MLFAKWLGVAALLTGVMAWGQTAAIDSRFDTPQVRVYVATLPPHVAIPNRNGHAANRVLICLDDGVMTRQDGEGPVAKLTVQRGQVRWRPGSGAYVAENLSDHPLRILEIDLKGKGGAFPVSKLDPVAVDAKHYKVEFENDQVRVLRVHYAAHEKGELHEHVLNRVVLYLNDQPGAKADDIRINGAATHVEENGNDAPADRIAVEIKSGARKTK